MYSFHPRTLLFGLHVPKCAGTSIQRVLERIVPPGRFHQSTSLFRNYRYDFLDFHHLSHVAVQELLAIWGHNVHEQMLLRASEFDRVIVWTVLRDPVERLRSELRYQFRQAESLGLEFDLETTLGSIEDPMCHYIIDRFPSLDPGVGSLAERSIGILKQFDFVLDLADTRRLTDLLSWFAGAPVDLPVENTAPGDNHDSLDASIFESRTVNDRLVYDTFCRAARPVEIGARIDECADRHKGRMSRIVPDMQAFRRFMTTNLFREFQAFGVLGTAISGRREMAESLLREADDLDAMARSALSLTR
jgi:hypothetical protein